MDSFIEKPGNEAGGNKIFLVALVIGILIVSAVVGFFALRPTQQQIVSEQLGGAVREGSPEFEALTRRIAIQTDEQNTTQSPTGMGTIVMMIAGRIRNYTGRTLTGLEVKVTVVDQLGNPVKDKVVAAVPMQQEKLEANESMPVRVMIEGFDKDDDRAMIRWKVTAIKAE
jgi:hypothetical protein